MYSCVFFGENIHVRCHRKCTGVSKHGRWGKIQITIAIFLFGGRAYPIQLAKRNVSATGFGMGGGLLIWRRNAPSTSSACRKRSHCRWNVGASHSDAGASLFLMGPWYLSLCDAILSSSVAHRFLSSRGGEALI